MKKDRIRNQRKALKLTQEALGKMVGVTKAAVSQWEKSNSNIEGSNLLGLAKALKVTPEWINTGKEIITTNFDAAMDEPATTVAAQVIPIFDRANLALHLKGEEATHAERPPERPGLYSSTMFALVEDMDGMAPLIVKDEIIYIEPNSKPEGGKDCMFWVNEIPLVGCLNLTATGMFLGFISNAQGWDSVPVSKDDFIGRVVHITHTRYQ